MTESWALTVVTTCGEFIVHGTEEALAAALREWEAECAKAADADAEGPSAPTLLRIYGMTDTSDRAADTLYVLADQVAAMRLTRVR